MEAHNARGFLEDLDRYIAMWNTREHDKLQSAFHVGKHLPYVSAEAWMVASSTKDGHAIQT